MTDEQFCPDCNHPGRSYCLVRSTGKPEVKRRCTNCDTTWRVDDAPDAKGWEVASYCVVCSDTENTRPDIEIQTLDGKENAGVCGSCRGLVSRLEGLVAEWRNDTNSIGRSSRGGLERAIRDVDQVIDNE